TPETARTKASPTSPSKNGGCRYVDAHDSASARHSSGGDGTPLRVDGRAGPPTYDASSCGWWTAPRSTSSGPRRATAEHHQVSPRTKLKVPSTGSITHARPLFPGR